LQGAETAASVRWVQGCGAATIYGVGANALACGTRKATAARAALGLGIESGPSMRSGTTATGDPHLLAGVGGGEASGWAGREGVGRLGPWEKKEN